MNLECKFDKLVYGHIAALAFWSGGSNYRVREARPPAFGATEIAFWATDKATVGGDFIQDCIQGNGRAAPARTDLIGRRIPKAATGGS